VTLDERVQAIASEVFDRTRGLAWVIVVADEHGQRRIASNIASARDIETELFVAASKMHDAAYDLHDGEPIN